MSTATGAAEGTLAQRAAYDRVQELLRTMHQPWCTDHNQDEGWCEATITAPAAEVWINNGSRSGVAQVWATLPDGQALESMTPEQARELSGLLAEACEQLTPGAGTGA